MLEITLDDLWPDIKKQIDDLMPLLMEKDHNMYNTMELLVTNYEMRSDSERIVASVKNVNDIYDVITGKDYIRNIGANETLEKKIIRFVNDFDMFRSMFNHKYDEVEFKKYQDQFKEKELPEGIVQTSEQLKRNEDIYNQVDDKTLMEALAKDKAKRREEIKKIFIAEEKVESDVSEEEKKKAVKSAKTQKDK